MGVGQQPRLREPGVAVAEGTSSGEEAPWITELKVRVSARMLEAADDNKVNKEGRDLLGQLEAASISKPRGDAWDSLVTSVRDYCSPSSQSE